MVLRWPTIIVFHAIVLRASAPDRTAQIPMASHRKDSGAEPEIPPPPLRGPEKAASAGLGNKKLKPYEVSLGGLNRAAMPTSLILGKVQPSCMC